MRDVFVQGQRLNAWLIDQLLSNLPKETHAAQPGGLKNHPLWIVGHITFWAYHEGELLNATRHAPKAYAELFGTGSQPSPDASKYPPLDELRAAYHDVRGAVSKAFLAASDAELARPNPSKEWAELFPTVGAMVGLGMAAHDSLHIGQLTSWRRAMGFPPAF